MVQGKQNMVGTAGERMSKMRFNKIKKFVRKIFAKHIRNCESYSKNSKKNIIINHILSLYGIIFIIFINTINSNIFLIAGAYVYAIVVMKNVLMPNLMKFIIGIISIYSKNRQGGL
jgi:hypothetical protein